MSDSKENVDVLKMYGEDSTTKRDEFLKKHNLNEKGLTSKQAEINIKKFGLNETKKAKPKKWYNYLLQSLLTPFNCILIGISIILIYTDIYLAIEPSYANIIVIAILVTASTLLDFFESYRSNKAAEKLREIVETTTTVIRDNKEINIPVKNVTLGDIVLLSAGSIIPADLRIIESKDLYVGQASLTGESDNIKKTVELENNQEELDSISDFDNICFMGTNVVSGSAKGVVIKVGDSTYFGEIANTVTSGKEKTAFQKGIESISKLLIRIMIFMIPIVFLINVEKHDIILAFTFAVAIAICITPLLLPVILSSSLSKGAVRMSKKKTIVKKLDSIQNFGAMNIFCTDKTGTLTEDKIVLEKYLNVNGEEDFNILKYAFLNAYLQTGLKSNIDEAVVAKAKTVGIENSLKKYKKIDEIPFDFSRRCLSVAVEIDNKDELITKGAVEEILNICTTFEYKGQTEKLTNEKIENMKRICKNLNEEGFRVVAICKKIITNNKRRTVIDIRIVFLLILTVFIIISTSINVAKYHIIFFMFTLLAICLNIYIAYHSQGIILTKEGKEEKLKLVELKNYINDYSLIRNRDLESVIIWDKYLAYATAFGIPNKITNSIYEKWYNLNINLQVVEKILS